MDWSWSQCIKSHHTQTSSGKGLPSHFWNRNNVRRILTGLRRKNWAILSGPKSSFHIKVNFCISFGNQGLEENWRGMGSKLLEVQCEVSKVSDNLGCRDVCWCWSIVFYQVQSQCSRLPGDFGALYAFICWQTLRRCWFPFPSGLMTMILLCLICQPTCLTWTPYGIYGISKISNIRPKNTDELKAAIKATWASKMPQQCYRLIASMPRRIEAVLCAKGAPSKFWVYK